MADKPGYLMMHHFEGFAHRLRTTMRTMRLGQSGLGLRQDFHHESPSQYFSFVLKRPQQCFHRRIIRDGMRTVLLLLAISSVFMLLVPPRSMAQQSSDYDEVVFGFTLKNLGSYNIEVAVKNDTVYLPIMELFNIFEVHYTVQGQNNVVGTYISSQFPMTINPVKRLITLGDKRYQLTKEDIFKGDMDIYLSTDKFDEIFGIKSKVNMNRLQIIAETDKELPALVRIKAAQQRARMESTPLIQTKYPLLFDLHRTPVSGSVLDYSITSSLNNLSPQGTSYTFTGGSEVAGGDLSGSLIGQSGLAPTLSDLRWRYVVRNNDYFSSFTAGQVPTGSEFIPSVTGIAVSNEPVEPRVLFDNYVVDGYTEPESDVELYLNDRLVDFQRANAAGYYRFQFPLTYGTMRITIKTYSKYGDINVDEKQVQVPFTFVPKGVLTYDVQTGKGTNLPGLANDVYFGNANLIYGATDWLSVNGGFEQSSNSGLKNPIFHGGFSSRLFTQYILDMDVAPNSYYKFDANALYASNAGIFVQYAKYLVNDTLIGALAQQNASLALYVPLTFVSPSTGFRLSEDYTDAASGKFLSPRLDLSTRITNVQVLLSYTAETTGTTVHPLILSGNGLLTATAMYAFPAASDLPDFLRVFLLRGEATYGMQSNSLQDITFQASKTFADVFQFNLGIGRDFVIHSTSVQLGLIMDLNVTRESSVFTATSGDVSSRHSLYGSVSYDQNSRTFLLSNREEADKGGVEAVLFVDNNNDSVYDAGDELIPAKGVKVNGMGKIEVGRDSLIRISDLQSYFQYNFEVDRQQIDPDLVPALDKFSFVVDPNQYKRIEIPFYRGGTISGTAYLDENGVQSPLSGARIILRSTTRPYADTLRTFADGGFYSMDVEPDSYTLSVDSTQLQFLQAVQKDGPLSVTVHRTKDGDITDTIEIDVVKGVQPNILKREEVYPQLNPGVEDTNAVQTAENPEANSVKDTSNVAAAVVPPPVPEVQNVDTFETPSKTGVLMNEYEEALRSFRSIKYTDAITLLEKMLSEDVPDYVADHCHYWIGESNYALKKYRDALQEFDQVLTYPLSEKRRDAQFMIGRCYEKLGSLEKAKEAFQKVVREYPIAGNIKIAKIHLTRFAQYEDALDSFEARKYDDAAGVLKKMLDENVPDYFADHCHYWIGESKYGSKKYEEALREFNVVLGLAWSEKRADAQFMIAECYIRLGSIAKAKENLQKVVREYPNTASVEKARTRLRGM